MKTVGRYWPRLLLWLPVLAMVGLAERANRWMPHDTMFGRANECAIDGECFTPAAKDHVDAMAWQFALCALLVCVGAVLSGRTLDHNRRSTSKRADHLSPAHGVLAGLLGFLAGVLGVFVVVGTIGDTTFVTAAMVLLLALAAAQCGEVLLRFGGGTRAGSYLLSAAVVGVTFLGTALVGIATSIAAIVLVPLTSSLLAVLGVWVSRRLMAVEPGLSMWPYALCAWVLPVVLGTFVLTNTWTDATQVTESGAAEAARTAEAPTYDPSPPDPTPVPQRTGAAAARACSGGDLELQNLGWDAWTGNTTTAIVAVNTSATPCWIDGRLTLRIVQGARDLRLVPKEGGDAPDLRDAMPSRRVGLVPGAKARTDLFWPGYRQAADQTTPQQLFVTVAGSQRQVPISLPGGAAPFDLIDGGLIYVSPWSAA